MMEKAEEKGVKLLLPVDNRIGDEFSEPIDANIESCSMRDRFRMARKGLDIGPETAKLLCRRCKRLLRLLYGTDRWDASKCRTSHTVPQQ